MVATHFISIKSAVLQGVVRLHEFWPTSLRDLSYKKATFPSRYDCLIAVFSVFIVITYDVSIIC